MQVSESQNGSFSPMEQGSIELLERLSMMARPDAVFSAPTIVGERLVIGAAQVTLGIGLGFGGGKSGAIPQHDQSTSDGERTRRSDVGGGGGGGGGGTSRPIAVISVGPDGVQVKPIVDVTTIAIACLSLLGVAVFEIRKVQLKRT